MYICVLMQRIASDNKDWRLEVPSNLWQNSERTSETDFMISTILKKKDAGLISFQQHKVRHVEKKERMGKYFTIFQEHGMSTEHVSCCYSDQHYLLCVYAQRSLQVKTFCKVTFWFSLIKLLSYPICLLLLSLCITETRVGLARDNRRMSISCGGLLVPCTSYRCSIHSYVSHLMSLAEMNVLKYRSEPHWALLMFSSN